MGIRRRDFLKLACAGSAVAVFGGLGFDLRPARAAAAILKLQGARQTTSICCYCSTGCGLLVSTAKDGSGRCVNVEGNPDHPVSLGALCPKGSSIWQMAENDRRVVKPLYRAPNSDKWQEKSWDWTLAEIAKRVKAARDAGFMAKNGKGETVNRCETMASVGSAALDNEECWALQSLMRALGLTYIEHQARICHSSTVPALAETYGRGAMTNHWIDIGNADCVLIMGGNAAEAHPVGFRWVMEAKKRGAPLIHVDPRFTRTSSKADIYARLRSGTDIAFLGGMAKYILDNELFQKDYVLQYTNAALLVSPDFAFNDGLFSGYDPAGRKYDKSKWAFVLDANGAPKRDDTLADPRCVMALLRAHYARYDPQTVSSVTGTSPEKLLEVYKTFATTGTAEKSGTILYAMGWTQHTVGVQNIRTMALIQLLLGNIGVAGGGVNALRGESNVQGSTDAGLLFHSLPGYLPTPRAPQKTLADYCASVTPKTGDPKSLNWKKNQPKYMASLLKSMYLDVEPAVSYDWLPKLEPGQDASWLTLFDHMGKGRFKGFFAWGMNPAASSANAGKTRAALAKLDWMVNVNLFENETGSFWKGPGVDPKKVKTEVFFLPACVSIEKEGSITNSGRWMQWRYPGPKPLGQSKPDGDIAYELFLAVRDAYTKAKGAFPEPILGANLKDWGDGHSFDPQKLARLINGYYVKDVTVKAPDGTETTYKAGSQVTTFANLRDDGSTTSGDWIYCGSYVDPDPAKGNLAARMSRDQTPEQAKVGLFPNWAWAWPLNRRVLYNRAGVDAKGQPLQPQKAVLAWDEAAKKWVGDIPDGGGAPGAIHPFIMQTHGLGQLYGPGLNDGPFPEHYEPLEGPIASQPFSKQLHNPAALIFPGEEALRSVADPAFPVVCTTMRVTEHWQTGLMTRWTPWLLEAEPQMFCEMSFALAKERGIENGDKVVLQNKRGKIWAIAMVTNRMQPMTILGKTTHQVAIPWHFAWVWPADGGDSANLLTPSVGDANTGIPETKAFMVNVAKA